MSRKAGVKLAFTLVELLVVISIIALLLGIMAPTLGKAKRKAQQVVCMSNLKQIYLAFELYTHDHDNTYPCAKDGAMPWPWMGRGWRPLIEPYLATVVDTNSPSILLCPVDKKSVEKYESTSYAYSMSFYHSPSQINSMNTIAHTYSAPLAVPAIGQKTTEVSTPSEKIIIGEWLSVHQAVENPDDDKGWWCWVGRRNYLFADGSMDYIKAEDIAPANDGNPNPCITVDGIHGSDQKIK